MGFHTPHYQFPGELSTKILCPPNSLRVGDNMCLSSQDTIITCNFFVTIKLNSQHYYLWHGRVFWMLNGNQQPCEMTKPLLIYLPLFSMPVNGG